ncbi:MAG: hypothetical protein ACOYMA_00340 [Bacteroidia bacterium]
MINHYYVDDSNFIFEYLSNGIKSFDSNKYASDININNVFNNENRNYIPAIYKIKDKQTKLEIKEAFATPDLIEIIDPKEIGIISNSSSIVANIYKTSIDSIISRIQKVAQNLAIDNEDLAKYLSLTVKMATDNNIKNAFVSYDYLMSKLDGNNKKIFKQAYESEKVRAKEYSVLNDRAILMSAMIKAGVKLE